MKNYIIDLIFRMNGELDDPKGYKGSERPSWQAYREAEKLDDVEYFPLLMDFLSRENNVGRCEKAFIIIGYLAANLKNPELLEWMLAQVHKEMPGQLLYAIFSAVSDGDLALINHIDKLVYFVDDDREMVRNAAIRGLRLDATQSSETEKALIDVLEHYYDEHGVRYAANSLEKIGTKKSIPYLEKVLEKIEGEETVDAVKRTLKTLKKKLSDFFIQLGHPKINSLDQTTFDELREVFRSLFRENEESAYLFWHEIPIRFHYTYELYSNINELVAILWLVYSREEGANKTHLITDTLLIDWDVRWDVDSLTIKSSFNAKKEAYRLYADALNQFPLLTLSRNDFLTEWNMLILQLIKSIRTAGIEITDSKDYLKLEVLHKIAANTSGYGILYTND